MLHRLRNALIVLASLGVVLVSSLLLLGKRYEPAVRTGLMNALNERLDAPVSVSGMDLTLIARFPNASLRLHDVLALEVRSDGIAPDTLLYAEELFLEFSLWDLFRGQQTVQRVHARKALVQPALDTKGLENYRIWKSDTTGSASVIALEELSFDDLQLRFRDHRSGLELASHSRTLQLRGTFGPSINDLELDGDVHLLRWAEDGSILMADRKVNMRMDIAFGGDANELHITRGELSTGQVPLAFTLDLVQGRSGKELDLRANGLDLPLADAAAMLPDELAGRLERYGLQGRVDLALRYTGPLEGEGPALAVGARISNGRMKERRSGATLHDIQGDLTLELTPGGVPQLLVVKEFSARNGKGSISGNWSSNGLRNAEMKADIRGDIALADLLRFAQVDTLELVQGHLRAEARMEGRLRDVSDIKASDLRTLHISGTLQLSDATLKLKGVRHRLEHLDAELALEGNNAVVRRLQGDLQGSTISLQGHLIDLMPYLLFDTHRLIIEAQASSPRIDLGAMLARAPSGTDPSTGDTPYALSLPATIELDLKARVDTLIFEDFKASAISGSVSMRDRVLRAAPMQFNTASGRVFGDLELDARSDGSKDYPLAIDARFQDMDITQLFREFKDFGQDFIGHRNLSGRSQAHIVFRAPLSPRLQIDLDALVCTIDIAVDNGGIRDHKPLLEVAGHLQRNKLVSPFVDTEELKRRLAEVRFARLENRIEIRNGAVHIPTMDVRSTAMDIELSGTHWFDDRIDHHLNFRLGELFRMGKPQRDEFGPIIDDGTGMRIFLHMYGTASDPLFANDDAMAAERRRQQFEQEKQELRNILREDLGFFKGRGEGREAGTPVERPGSRVQVEWGTSDPETPEGTTTQKRRKGPGRLPDGDGQEPRERVVVED